MYFKLVPKFCCGLRFFHFFLYNEPVKIISTVIWFDTEPRCDMHIVKYSLCFVSQAVNSYGTDPQFTNFLDNMDFYVLPVMNVDGYAYSWTTVSRLWKIITKRSSYFTVAKIEMPNCGNISCRTACGERPALQTRVLPALEPTPTETSMLDGAVSVFMFLQNIFKSSKTACLLKCMRSLDQL